MNLPSPSNEVSSDPFGKPRSSYIAEPVNAARPDDYDLPVGLQRNVGRVVEPSLKVCRYRSTRTERGIRAAVRQHPQHNEISGTAVLERAHEKDLSIGLDHGTVDENATGEISCEFPGNSERRVKRAWRRRERLRCDQKHNQD
jgi:hypothetical protein